MQAPGGEQGHLAAAVSAVVAGRGEGAMSRAACAAGSRPVVCTRVCSHPGVHMHSASLNQRMGMWMAAAYWPTGVRWRARQRCSTQSTAPAARKQRPLCPLLPRQGPSAHSQLLRILWACAGACLLTMTPTAISTTLLALRARAWCCSPGRTTRATHRWGQRQGWRWRWGCGQCGMHGSAFAAFNCGAGNRGQRDAGSSSQDFSRRTIEQASHNAYLFCLPRSMPSAPKRWSCWRASVMLRGGRCRSSSCPAPHPCTAHKRSGTHW